MIAVGFGNYVNEREIVATVEPHAQPIRNLVRAQAKAGNVIDCTAGRITRSIIVLNNGTLIRCCLTAEIIAMRATLGFKPEASARISLGSRRMRERRGAATDTGSDASGSGSS